MAISAKPYPLVQLLTGLQKEGIRFMLAGMSAANLQGVMEGTIDVDVWIDLPTRHYMRVINVCRKLGATIQSPNKVYLSDDTPVDFIYEISGLRSFDWEYRRVKRLAFHGIKVPVLPLERVCRSKQAAGRDKDKLHILLIRQVMRLQRTAAKRPATKQRRRPKD